jgi:hypothetical protein
MRGPRSRSVLRLGVFAGFLLAALLAPHAASAQVTLDPTEVATKDTGGWVYWMAEGAIILGGVVLILFGAMYLRYAPRFQREEENVPRSGVRAPEPTVPLQTSWQQAAPPVATQPVPAPQPVAPPTPAAAAAAPAPAAPAAAPAPAAPAAAGGASAPAASEAVAPTEAAPAAEGAPATEAAPAAAAAAAPARARGEPVELDQETYERVLAEETAKGTSARVAEGRAKSAAVKAWRAKTGNT